MEIRVDYFHHKPTGTRETDDYSIGLHLKGHTLISHNSSTDISIFDLQPQDILDLGHRLVEMGLRLKEKYPIVEE